MHLKFHLTWLSSDPPRKEVLPMLELRSAETDKGRAGMPASASVEADRGMPVTMRAGAAMPHLKTGPNTPGVTYCIASGM